MYGFADRLRHKREKKERRVKRAKERKGIEALRVKHPTPSREIYAFIGEVEKNEKQKRTNIKQ